MNQTCSRCGNTIEANDIFCSNCGQKFIRVTPSPPIQPTSNPQDEPLTLGKCIFGFLLLMIPIVNIICVLVWAISKKSNTNAKNIARTLILATLLSIALFVFGITRFFVQFTSFTTPHKQTIEEIVPSIPWHDLDLPFDVSTV